MINNVCAYVIAGLTSSIAAVRGISSITWLDSGIQLGGFAVFAVLALLIARRMKLRRPGGSVARPVTEAETRHPFGEMGPIH